MIGDILFLAHRQPYPPNRGDSIRSWNIIKALSRLARVHVVAFGQDDQASLKALSEVCASVHLIPNQRSRTVAMAAGLLSGRPASVELFRSDAVRHAIEHVCAGNLISVVYAYSGQMGQYAQDFPSDARFVMDFTDVDSEKFASYGRANGGPIGLANRVESKRLLTFERQVARRADISLFVSKTEETLFRRLVADERLALGVLENGVDLETFSPGAADVEIVDEGAPLIVFTGQMDYPPNVDAVIWFVTYVLPIVRERQADARFAIVGRAPTQQVLDLSSLPGVIVTGEVPDTRPWLSAAKVVVAPLRIARGIQNKVLEAMASGKAVVASPEAAEGIDACHEREFIIAASAAAQADAVVSLLHDATKRARMEQAARAAMEARYSWDAKMAALPELICPDANIAAA